jgi:hypothetical protein
LFAFWEIQLRFFARIFFLLAALQIAHVVAYGASSRSSQYFFNRADFATGQYPHGVAIADMNSDGRADLIVANTSDGSVSVLLGQTDGTFGAKTDFPVTGSPANLIAGDFDGDGKIDVAVTVPSGVMILRGNGDGTLNSPVAYSTANTPYLLAPSDFNHDGKLDLVVGGNCSTSGTTCGLVGVLLGNGDGTFQPEKDTPAGGVPSAMTVLDLNGDGIPDLTLANEALNSVTGGTPGVVSVLLGNGDGTFKAAVNYPSGSNIAGIAAGDATGDKIPDLVVSHYFSPTITVLKGNGDGSFQAEQQISTDSSLGSAYLELLDLNNDGKVDLLMSSVDNSGAAVLLGNGDGTFQPAEVYATGGQPYFFATADVNGDQNIDICVVDSYGNYITVLLGNGDGTFSPRKNLPLGNSQPNVDSAVIGDFDGDGKPDVAVSVQTGLAVLLGNGNGTFKQSLVTNTTAQSLSSTSAADFNRDGHVDLLLNGTTLLLGRGDGTFGTPIKMNSDSSTRSFVVGDFNGDGYPDVVDVGNGFLESQPMQILLGNGDGSFQPVRRFWSLSTIPDKVVAADFNHDGKLDLALTVNPNGVAVLLGNGDGSFADPIIYPTDDLPSGLTVADVNGDGAPDLIATGNKVDVFLGKGDGTFPSRVDYVVSGFPDQPATGDFDGDGKLDIAVTANAGGPGYLEILFGNGDGTFQGPISSADDAPVGAPVVVSDLNGDGIDDLLVAARNGSLFLSSPLATVSPSWLNFGTVANGVKSDSLAITVTNSGNGPLHVTGATVAAPFVVEQPMCQVALTRLANCTVPVALSPVTLGVQSGQVLVQEDALNSKPVVLVRGTAATPTLTLSAASITFSGQAVGTSSAAQTIILTNTSPVAVAFTSITANGQFAATSQCGTSLVPGATCSISVVFTPSNIGTQNGSLRIADDAAGTPQSISLTGTGFAALSITTQSSGSTSAVVKSGQPATYALTLAAGPGFSGTVSLACSGAPTDASCTMSPSSMILAGGGTGDFTVTVATSQQVANDQRRVSNVQLACFGLLPCAVLLPIVWWLRRSRLGMQSLLPLVLLTAAQFMLMGCSGGSSASTKPTPSQTTVNPGTYQMTITATSGSTSSTKLITLNVQ